MRGRGARTDTFPDVAAWSDVFDASSEHFVICEGGVPVAAARLTICASIETGPDVAYYHEAPEAARPAPLAYITRLVVCPAHAGRGLPKTLDIARLDRARHSGCRTVLASAAGKRVTELKVYGFKELYHTTARQPPPLDRIPPATVLALAL